MSEMGQKAKYSPRADVFRFAPESGLKSDIAGGPVRANNGSGQPYSITSSAQASAGGGTVRTEGLSGLEIDDQFELGGLHNAAEGASDTRRHSRTRNFWCQNSRTDSLACRLDRRHPRVVGKTAGNG
jgi:hypothetical protein